MDDSPEIYQYKYSTTGLEKVVGCGDGDMYGKDCDNSKRGNVCDESCGVSYGDVLEIYYNRVDVQIPEHVLFDISDDYYYKDCYMFDSNFNETSDNAHGISNKWIKLEKIKSHFNHFKYLVPPHFKLGKTIRRYSTSFVFCASFEGYTFRPKHCTEIRYNYPGYTEFRARALGYKQLTTEEIAKYGHKKCTKKCIKVRKSCRDECRMLCEVNCKVVCCNRRRPSLEINFSNITAALSKKERKSMSNIFLLQQLGEVFDYIINNRVPVWNVDYNGHKRNMRMFISTLHNFEHHTNIHNYTKDKYIAIFDDILPRVISDIIASYAVVFPPSRYVGDSNGRLDECRYCSGFDDECVCDYPLSDLGDSYNSDDEYEDEEEDEESSSDDSD